MLGEKRIVVVMPAYNAARTLMRTYREVIGLGMVDSVILGDDNSQDETERIARSLPNVTVHAHSRNMGYGANQKSCYRLALKEKADIVIIVHPDYQYTPKLIPAMAAMIVYGGYHCVLASRILGGYALKGGMPWWKYVANRFLTFVENILLKSKVSEFHTGYRAYTRELLMKVPFEKNSDDFLFDNQILAQILWLGYTIGEISCPTRYFPEASSINFRRSVEYGFGCLETAMLYRLNRMGILRSELFSPER